jgi:DNA polymerase-3 subunit beta
VQVTSRVLGGKNSNPIFNFLYFSVNENVLTIVGSDGDTSLSGSMLVENVEGSIDVLLLGNQIAAIMPKLGDQPLTFSIDERSYSVEITTMGGKYNYIGQSAAEYPQAKALVAERTAELTLDAAMLQKGISSTAFAACDDDLRPVMQGVYVDMTPEGLNFVATDARQLALYQITDKTFSEPANFIFPAKTASILKNFLSKEQGDVRIQFDGSALLIQTANYRLVSRLIEGRFPNYKAVIPAETVISAIVDTDGLKAAFDRVSLCASDNNLVRMLFEEGKVSMLSQDIDFSLSGEESMPCQFNGAPIEIGVKAKYMTGVLQNIASDQVEIKLIDATRPILLVPVTQPENTKTTMLLTPMTL